MLLSVPLLIGNCSIKFYSTNQGDPLSLIFLVQGVAITRRLKSLPPTYAGGFAGGFAMFNLQMSPPKWAKPFMEFERWMPGFDKSTVGDALKNHLFWLLVTFGSTLVIHLTVLHFWEKMKWTIPKFMKYPQVEIKAFMVMNMGMLDIGSDVLVDTSAAIGWRVIGFLECSCAVIFVYWFWSKGRDFQDTNDFIQNKNVKALNMFVAIDADDDGEM